MACAVEVPAPNVTGIISSDNCEGGAPVTFVGDVITNQTCANRYTITRTYRARDICENQSQCSQIITVFDNTLPTIICPANITVECVEDVPLPNVAGIISSDNCGGVNVITFVGDVITNQTCPNQYSIIRTYRATDVCGNSVTCSQLITVMDNIPPVITFINPLLEGDTVSVQCYGQDPEWNIPVFDESSVSAIDNCAGQVTLTFNQVLVNEGDCIEDGYINLYRLTWTAIDVCGNSANVSIFLQLVDTIPPVIEGIPADITVSCDELPALPTVFAVDECLCACVVLFEESILLQGCQNGQVLTRSWTAIDRCGNQTIETQLITLIDDEAPAIQLPSSI